MTTNINDIASINLTDLLKSLVGSLDNENSLVCMLADDSITTDAVLNDLKYEVVAFDPRPEDLGFAYLYLMQAASLIGHSSSQIKVPAKNFLDYFGIDDDELRALPLMAADLAAAKASVKAPNCDEIDLLVAANKNVKHPTAKHVGQSLGNVAIVLPMDKRGVIQPLTIDLFKLQDEQPSDTPTLTLVTYPSLECAFQLYSTAPSSDEQQDSGDWWQGLKNACAAALSEYRKQVEPSAPQLTGHFVARWHVDRRPYRNENFHTEWNDAVAGDSHGAAFGLSLTQALARAHVKLTQPSHKPR